MNSRPFVHLHCHSHYSLQDGVSTIEQLVRRAKELGMNALALTDHGNLCGALEFYREAVRQGIKPIIGYEAYVAPGHRTELDESVVNNNASYHLTLLAENRQGYQNLLKLASAAYLEGYCLRPHIDRELLARHHEGLICLSGCESSELSRAILHGGEEGIEQAVKVATWHQDLFRDRYLLEIQNNGLILQRRAMEGIIEVSQRLNIDLVATSDVHCIDQKDAKAHKLIQCFRLDTTWANVDEAWGEDWDFHLRSPEEMYEAFGGMEEAVRLTQEVADLVDPDLELGKKHFPAVALPEGKASEERLRELCHVGLQERYADDPERCIDGQLSQEVSDRLDHELRVIHNLGLDDVFLIVEDIVRFARSKNIVHALRGSGLGSLVCYALGISNVCPLQHGLLSETFLDEHESSMPNIDIDFDRHRLKEVLQYIKDTYGEECVGRPATFITRGARWSLRETGNALELSREKVDSLVALVPKQPETTLQRTLEDSEEFRKACETDEIVRESVDLAGQLEGLTLDVVPHACSVVVADRPLTEYVPLQVSKVGNQITTQWPVQDLEEAGLLAIDFLGLRELTTISKTIDLIRETTGQQFSLDEIPLDDQPTFEMLCQGDVDDICEWAPSEMAELRQKLFPCQFSDVVILMALQWPHSSKDERIEEYLDRRQGKRVVDYIHPAIEEVFQETCGMILFREQTMQILHRLGGIELANTREYIKRLRSGDKQELERIHEHFTKEVRTRDLGPKVAEELFGLVQQSAKACPMKSHMMASALMFYKMAYLKTHWPKEFQRAVEMAKH